MPVKYEEIYRFNREKDHWALVRLHGMYGFIDTSGKEVVPPVMADIAGKGKFHELKDLFSSGGSYLKDLGRVKKYQITKFENGMAAIRHKKTWRIGLINEKMEIIVPPEYRKILVDGEGNIHVW